MSFIKTSNCYLVFLVGQDTPLTDDPVRIKRSRLENDRQLIKYLDVATRLQNMFSIKRFSPKRFVSMFDYFLGENIAL